ncbi:MAG: hypothetical protein RSD11_08550 [Bacteroides sp.]|uniref:hypothetical protein n=1 Tax=Bacteroides sp. TaxID=29523 RepID=UPI002FCC000B
MNEMPFSIQTLKMFQQELELCLGFTFDEIEEELGQIWKNKSNSLTEEELTWAKKCGYGNTTRIRTREFALELDEDVYIEVTDNYKNHLTAIKTLCDDYKIEDLEDGKYIIYFLQFMAAIFNRDSNNLTDAIDSLNGKEDYYKYTYKVRPDMLKLFIALHQDKCQVSDKLKISIQGNPPIELENNECWFEEMLAKYLDEHLGVNDVQEAQEELDCLYTDKIGRKASTPYLNYVLVGTFNFIQENIIQSKTGKATIEQCKFLHRYLRGIELISPDDKNNNLNNLQSTINSLISSKLNPVERHRLDKKHKSSPFKSWE